MWPPPKLHNNKVWGERLEAWPPAIAFLAPYRGVRGIFVKSGAYFLGLEQGKNRSMDGFIEWTDGWMAGYKCYEASSFTALDVIFTAFSSCRQWDQSRLPMSLRTAISMKRLCLAVKCSDRVCPTDCGCELRFPWQGSGFLHGRLFMACFAHVGSCWIACPGFMSWSNKAVEPWIWRLFVCYPLVNPPFLIYIYIYIILKFPIIWKSVS